MWATGLEIFFKERKKNALKVKKFLGHPHTPPLPVALTHAQRLNFLVFS
jgi:hypothetical protein